MTGNGRYGVNAPIIGPCSGDCGLPGRARIKPCYPTRDGWFCHDCIQTQQAETAARLQNGDVVLPDGGTSSDDTERCETDGCHRQTDRVMAYEVWDDGLSERERRVCGPCENAMQFRETFASGRDSWSVDTGTDQDQGDSA